MVITKEKKISFGLALVAAALTCFLYLKRDDFFTWAWADGSGAFRAVENLSLREAAVAYAEKKEGGTCVGRWAGMDDKYVYLALGCGRFTETLGEYQVEGDASPSPARFRYEGSEVTGMERGSGKSLRRLFPKAAGAIYENLLDGDFYRRAGYERSNVPGPPGRAF